MNTVHYIDGSQTKRAIALCFKAGIIPCLTGDVGVGKTSVVNDFVQTLIDAGVNTKLETRILSQCDISNFELPVKNDNGRIEGCVADWIPLEEDDTENTPTTIIFFDEIDRAGIDMQNMALNLLLGRQISNKKISDKVFFITARNGSSDMYTQELSDASISRMCILYMKSSFDSYEKWAVKNDISPARIAFHKFNADKLMKVSEFADVSIPTSRSLDFVDKVVEMTKTEEIRFKTDDVINPIIAGLIGIPAQIEYTAFLDLYEKIPTPDKVLADPQGTSIDLEPSILYALLTSVIQFAKDDLDKCEKAYIFIRKLPPEFKQSGFAALLEKNPESIVCPTAVKMSNGG